MNLQLENKIALVTGASSGIGAATASLLAQEGADVVICYQANAAGAARCAQAVRDAGRRVWLCQLDISDAQDAAAAVARLRAQIARLDVVVLCAGRNIVTPFESLTPAEWDQVIAVNLSGPFYLLHALLPLLNADAAVVAVSSVAAHTGAPHHAHYAAAKAGLVNLTKSLARALAPRVRVNAVCPGLTLTPMGQETIDELPSDYARAKLLAQRFATPQEIARCIVFLSSPAASFVFGATLDVNGGRYLR